MYLQFTGTDVRVLGSMHVFPATSRRTPPWVADAYDWADALIFESDAPSLLPLLRADSQHGAARLRDCMSGDAWLELQKRWPADGPLAPLVELHPWAVLSVAPLLFQQIVEGVEPRMLRSACAHRKTVRYLETAQDVAASLAPIPLQTIAAALELLIADRDEPQRTLERMHAVWLGGDPHALLQVALDVPMFNLPGVRHALLDARNRAWAAHVDALLEARPQQKTLVVVGALHLCGAGNLLDCVGHPVEAIP